MIVGLVLGVVSLVAFTVYFLFWWALPDSVWEASLVAALVALFFGGWATVRQRRLAKLGGIAAMALGLFVIGYFAFITLTYGD